MRILYLTQRLNMNNRGIQTDLLNALSAYGHKVTVVACEQKENILSKQNADVRGLEVVYVPAPNQFGVSAIKKGIVQILMPWNMIKRIRRYLKGRKFDLVMYATPPVTFAPVVQYCKKVFGCRSFLALKDIFPQNAVDLGMMSKNGLLYKLFRIIEKHLYDVSDYIGCMSESNIQYVSKHNPQVSGDKLILFPNTIEPYQVSPDFTKEGFREKYNIPKDKVVFLFGGNLGKPQAVDLLLQAIEQLRDYPIAYFLIVGKGSEYNRIHDFLEKNNCTNTQLMEFLPSEEYNCSVLACDVGLLLLRAEMTVPNIPERTLSYMAGSIPILAATDTATDIGDIVENKARCGKWCVSNQLDKFIEYIKFFCENPQERENMGLRGREFFDKNWHVSFSIETINSLFGDKA